MTAIRYSRRSLNDLESIRRFISRDNPVAAGRVIQHLEHRISRLANDATLATASSNPRFRILFPTKYPYRIYFEVAHDYIAILHIRHTSRELPKLRGFNEE